ncbi:ArsR/SmtB family transcription factor [Nocardia africana]|uniref:HTH-type transcriptional repressor CzrA n=1 Tax=Nocardia africana TaxID=134964 RepID=A0A378X535_9NOCA|nr:metalloregulator ArsR/SmtB family transcription factor [Nocardia africana]MCC3317384.1 metalloregulator ArsR/SmtB family transcription factor [Nocardia africana]SUA48127.1 HTH-type transcriptional repressor CzrA [Nocardia africana]
MTVPPARIFDALGDPVRRHILELLAAGEHSAGALVEAVRATATISQPAVSQHLKTLRDTGLVTVRAEGTRRYYRLDPDGVEIARTWLTTLLDPLYQLANPLDALATEVARGKRARHAGDSAAPPGGHESGYAAG